MECQNVQLQGSDVGTDMCSTVRHDIFKLAAMSVESAVDPNIVPLTIEQLARCLADPMWQL
jgi:hypothetical protein